MDSATSKYSREANAAFPAQAYLNNFTDPRTDSRQVHKYFMKGFHSFYEKYVNGSEDSKSLLEFGGGPALFSLISAAKHVESITFSEYAETNREKIRQWRDGGSERHDWSKFIEYVVTDLEGDTTEGAVERREIRMKQVIKEIIPCDASKSEFFEGEYQTRQYDIVQSSRCLESVCESREAYQRGIAQLSSYVKPGGYLQILTAVEAGYYSCSDAGNSHSLYAVPVGEEDVLKGFEIAGLSVVENMKIDRQKNLDVSNSKSFIFTVAQKKM